MVPDQDEPEAAYARCLPAYAAWTLPAGRGAVARARALARRTLAERGLHGEALAEGELMACELATNAVRHARPPYELRLRATRPASVVCEIVDALPALPPIPAEPAASGAFGLTLADIDTADVDVLEGGRGLAMVARLSGNHLGARYTRTHTTPLPTAAKAVWFALPQPSASA